VKPPKVMSTFSGCGGSSLGYKKAGCEVVAAVEWDDHAVESYRLNHPTTRVFHGDIADVKVETLLETAGLEVGELDILDGSPPCQGFSTAGARILDDPRNALFRQQLRLIDGLKPKCVVIENVSGMLKGKMRAVASEIYQSLEERGYEVSAGLIEAHHFGVAQRRARVFFVGSRIGSPRLPRSTHSRITCRKALHGVQPDEWRQTPPNDRVRWLLSHMRPGETGGMTLKRHGMKPDYWSSVMLDPNGVAHTITKTYPFGGVFHWTRRHLSVREAQVLTGFPVDYKLPGKFADRWARVGNSVAPPVAREIARQTLIPLLEKARG